MVEQWPMDKRKNVINSYMGERTNRRHKPGRALEKIHYSWDIVSDYGIFRDLQRHRMVDSLDWQLLSPRFGYSLPEIVEEAGFSGLYEECFDLSLQLYSLLQQDSQTVAQYATLLGHKMRWRVTFNARQAFHLLELRTSKQGHPGYRQLAQQMHLKIAEVHPLIASSMNFVDYSENSELSRLDSENRSKQKLEAMRQNNI
jgi:thymidylate synthase ThyX